MAMDCTAEVGFVLHVLCLRLSCARIGGMCPHVQVMCARHRAQGALHARHAS